MRIFGLDGKWYPVNDLTPGDLASVRGRCHYLKHDEGKSVREIVQILETEHNVTRSVGSVHSYLTDWRCEKCSGAA